MDGAAIVRGAEPGGACVDVLAHPVDGAEGLMIRDAMPGAEQQAVIDLPRPLLVPGGLARHGDPGDGAVGAFVLRPGDRRVLDGHGVGVRAELDAQLPLAAVDAEEVDHRRAKPVRPAREGDGRVLEGGQAGRDGGQGQLGDVGAVTERGLRVERLAQRVGKRLPAQGLEADAVNSGGRQGGHGTAQRLGQRLLPGLPGVGRGREQLEALVEALGVRGREGGRVHHDEVLRHVALGAGQAFSRHADDLDGEAARRGDGVVQDVARVGRDPEHDGKGRGAREDALGEFFRQAIEHSQLALEQPVALGVHAADGVPVILPRRFQDAAHRLVDGGGCTRLVRLRMFDGGGVGEGLVHGCQGCPGVSSLSMVMGRLRTRLPVA